MLTLLPQELLVVQPRGTYQRKQGPWLWEKDDNVSETVTLAESFMLREFLTIFHDIKGTNYKILEADPFRKEYNWPKQGKYAPFVL